MPAWESVAPGLPAGSAVRPRGCHTSAQAAWRCWTRVALQQVQQFAQQGDVVALQISVRRASARRRMSGWCSSRAMAPGPGWNSRPVWPCRRRAACAVVLAASRLRKVAITVVIRGVVGLGGRARWGGTSSCIRLVSSSPVRWPGLKHQLRKPLRHLPDIGQCQLAQRARPSRCRVSRPSASDSNRKVSSGGLATSCWKCSRRRCAPWCRGLRPRAGTESAPDGHLPCRAGPLPVRRKAALRPASSPSKAEHHFRAQAVNALQVGLAGGGAQGGRGVGMPCCARAITSM